MSTSIVPTTELSLKFDKMFDNLYDTQNILDNKIITNDSLIRQNMVDYQKQDTQNNALRIILVAVFLICIVVLLYRLKVFDSPMILTIIILAIIILAMLIVYYLYYMNDYNSYLERVSRDTNKTFSNSTAPIGNELNCDYLQEEESNLNIGSASIKDNNLIGKSLQSNYNRLIQNTNTNFNVWEEGDHISKKSINDNNVKNVDLDMANYRYIDSIGGSTDIVGKFNALPNGATYYDCEYTGSNPNGIPMQSKYIKSTIPCKYYIDYKETGKFIKNSSNTGYQSVKSNL